MRAVLQRVTSARVLIDGREQGRIGLGLLVLLGIEESDGPEDIEWLSRKLVDMRLFEPTPVPGGAAEASPAVSGVDGPGERSVLQMGGEILLISQFTLFASTRKGNRPSWHRAARPAIAIPIYEAFHRRVVELLGRPVPTGIFGAHMVLESVNDGPVTLLVDSKARE